MPVTPQSLNAAIKVAAKEYFNKKLQDPKFQKEVGKQGRPAVEKQAEEFGNMLAEILDDPIVQEMLRLTIVPVPTPVPGVPHNHPVR